MVLVPGDVDLLVGGDDAAGLIHERLDVPAPPVPVEQGVTEAEADTEAPGLVEQRLGGRVRHRPLVVVVELPDVIDEPPGEERGQCQLGIDDEIARVGGTLAEQVDEPLDDGGAAVLPVDGAELGGSDGDDAAHDHPCCQRGTVRRGSVSRVRPR